MCVIQDVSGHCHTFYPRVNGINHHKLCIHAEEVALNFISRKRLRVKNIYLFTAFYNRSSNVIILSNGNPCSRCHQLLINSGVINHYIGARKSVSSTPLIDSGYYKIDEHTNICFTYSMHRIPLTETCNHSYNSGRSKKRN